MTVQEANSLTAFQREILDELRKLRVTMEALTAVLDKAANQTI